MDGYDDRSYGEAFADVYDDWYHDVSDVEATVAELLELVGPGGRVLELGVGTGRLAVPLAEAGGATGVTVTGVDASPAMLARLAARDPDGLVTAVLGNMVRDVPPGPFDLAFVAYNTLFNLTGDGEQAACFRAMAACLVPGGRFVIEAFVPDEPPRSGDDVSVRTITAGRVVLSVAKYSPERRLAEGQFVEFTETGGVRLRPWAVRYASPAELDQLAAAAGFELERRSESFGDAEYRVEFDDHSNRHVSVYRRRLS